MLRRIFRAVWEKVQRIQACESRPFHVQWSSGSRQRRPWCEYSRQNEEFIADFELIARRTLTPRQHRIFRLHVLLGADWRFCAPRVGLDRGQFYHEVYRIQERLGRAFRETRPYGLFPVDEYFVVGRRAA